jgi:hypothetical protein
VSKRVSADDLAFAADWLDAYDGADEDGTPDANDDAARRVAAWLRAEIERRAEDAAVRDLVKSTGAPPTRIRSALRRSIAEQRASRKETA